MNKQGSRVNGLRLKVVKNEIVGLDDGISLRFPPDLKAITVEAST